MRHNIGCPWIGAIAAMGLYLSVGACDRIVPYDELPAPDGGVDAPGSDLPGGPDGRPDGPIVPDLPPDLPPAPDLPPDAPIPDVDQTVDQTVDVPAPPDGPPQDLPAFPDIPFVPDKGGGCKPGVIGKPCLKGSMTCGVGATCVLTEGSQGVCGCPCTPDDPATPLFDEDSCPDLSKHVCGTITMQSGSQINICLQKCTPQKTKNECAAGLACWPRSARAAGVESAVCLFPACASGADCPVFTKQICAVGAGSMYCSASTCLPVAPGAKDGRCVKSGKCSPTSGLCEPHAHGTATAKIGDPCTADTECAGDQLCMIEHDRSKYNKGQAGDPCNHDHQCCSLQCASGKCTKGPCVVDFRNGYCTKQGCQFSSTLPYTACPTGSTCNRFYPGGHCQKTCTLTKASTCRGQSQDKLGDYECRDWSNVSYFSQQLAAKPVCDYGTRVPCSGGPLGTIGCSKFGTTGNTTNMSCRSLQNKPLANKKDPLGFCLDDTPANTTTR